MALKRRKKSKIDALRKGLRKLIIKIGQWLAILKTRHDSSYEAALNRVLYMKEVIEKSQ
jgi:hypothetical protein